MKTLWIHGVVPLCGFFLVWHIALGMDQEIEIKRIEPKLLNSFKVVEMKEMPKVSLPSELRIKILKPSDAKQLSIAAIEIEQSPFQVVARLGEGRVILKSTSSDRYHDFVLNQSRQIENWELKWDEGANSLLATNSDGAMFEITSEKSEVRRVKVRRSEGVSDWLKPGDSVGEGWGIVDEIEPDRILLSTGKTIFEERSKDD